MAVSEVPMDSVSIGRLNASPKVSVSQFPSSPSRVSVLSSVVPYLRRQDVDKLPLLTLKLSSPSFLDTLINDDVTEQPLYSIRTVGVSTIVRRADPWDGDTKTAEIKWPRNLPPKGKGISDDVLIQMRGIRWNRSEAFLKRGTILSAPRKFNIPNSSKSLKWKRVGGSYWCTTSTVKGPIAIFDPATGMSPPKLNVYETLHDKYDARPMLIHHGVSLLLLDYLVVTALLLVTDVEEWTLLKKFEGKDIAIPQRNLQNTPGPSLSPPKSAPGNMSASDLQWRKIMFGEPLFPRKSSRSSISSSATSDGLPRTPLSAGQMAKIAYGHPLYSTLRPSSPDLSPPCSEEDDAHIFFSPIATRPSSPSAESIFYPRSTGSAPSHNYLDPSFYSQADVPPVPPIPPQYITASDSNFVRSPTFSSRPSSSHSTASSGRQRELPLPPVLPLILRPRSTPPRAMSSRMNQEPMNILGTPGSLPTTRRLPDPSTTARRPTRQLPQPPSPARVDNVNTQDSMSSGRARSHSLHPEEKWRPQYRQRTLPLPPIGSSRGGDYLAESDQDPRRRTLKETEDDLSRWMNVLTSGSRGFSPMSLPGSTYDMPPPAYNSINFSPRTELSNTIPPPPPLPASPPPNEG